MRKYLKLEESIYKTQEADEIIEYLEDGWKIERTIAVRRSSSGYVLIIFYKADNPSTR